MYLYRIMLHKMRGFIIEHKTIFLKAIIAFAKILPEPTREGEGQVQYANSLILLDKKDKFLEYENNPKHPIHDLPEWGREGLFEAIFKIFICEYDHDGYYHYRFDWFLEELVEEVISGRWKPRPVGEPAGCWKEPRDHGLYKGRNFLKYIEKEINASKTADL